MGWSVTPTIVIDTKEKAKKLQLNPSVEVCIVSQTTFNYKKFQELVEIISEKGYNINISNTICNATEERQTEARDIAKQVDAMVVIGGSSSSNTRKLYEICKNECDDTFYIQTLNDLAAGLHGILKEGDVLLTLGAGSITRLGPAWLEGQSHA